MARFQCYRIDEQGVRWRLLAGNNRVLGVGPAGSAGLAAVLRDIDLVRAHAAEARLEVVHASNGLWWWQMQDADGDIAQSAQGFARRVDAELAAARFRHRAPEADIDPVLLVFQPGRRGRAYPNGRSGSTEQRTPRD